MPAAGGYMDAPARVLLVPTVGGWEVPKAGCPSARNQQLEQSEASCPRHPRAA